MKYETTGLKYDKPLRLYMRGSQSMMVTFSLSAYRVTISLAGSTNAINTVNGQ
jgi:hypothetical protein